MIKLGCHVGMSGKEMILGSVKEAISYNANTFMIYTGAVSYTPLDVYKRQDLNLSSPTVSRVLALAREQGIVKISISNVDAVEHWELERKLEKEYGLQEVIRCV